MPGDGVLVREEQQNPREEPQKRGRDRTRESTWLRTTAGHEQVTTRDEWRERRDRASRDQAADREAREQGREGRGARARFPRPRQHEEHRDCRVEGREPVRHGVGGVVAQHRAHEREERRCPPRPLCDELRIAEVDRHTPTEPPRHDRERRGEQRTEEERLPDRDKERQNERISRGKQARERVRRLVVDEEAAAGAGAREPGVEGSVPRRERTRLEQVRRGVYDPRAAAQDLVHVEEREQRRAEADRPREAARRRREDERAELFTRARSGGYDREQHAAQERRPRDRIRGHPPSAEHARDADSASTLRETAHHVSSRRSIRRRPTCRRRRRSSSPLRRRGHRRPRGRRRGSARTRTTSFGRFARRSRAR